MQRIGVPFKKFTGRELKERFFASSDDPLEATIEKTYLAATTYLSDYYIDISSDRNEDGVVRYYYGRRNTKSLLFVGIDESKRNINATRSNLCAMLTQMLHYFYQAKTARTHIRYNYETFTFKSSKFFGYLLYNDIKDLYEELVPIFTNNPCSASKAWGIKSVRDKVYEHFKSLNFRLFTVDEDFRLDLAYKRMYEDYLER